jgi:CRISPR-associated protein Cmr2
MSHLLAISIGPVQEWIAAARRTRDLWFGSMVLSEISKAAAREIEKEAKLIFPAEVPKGTDTIANVILAEVEDGQSAEELQKKARAAAEKAWLGRYADKAKERVQQHIDSALWDEQANDVIEFYAAWTPLTEYAASRQNVMRLLAGRKACRNFRSVRGRAGVPKSSLDGARESVFRRSFKSADLDDDLAIALRLSRGEHLDCVGLTKRLGERQNFPSVARIAADPWIRGLAAEDAANLVKECEKIGERVLGRAGARYDKFPFDGSAIYRNRYPEIEEEGNAKGKLHDLNERMKRLEKKYGVPHPYLAMLIADGDKMGESISKIMSPEEHRKFSSKLAGFAQAARALVEKHYGCLVYAGGDDALAFLPVDQVLSCGRQLHDLFGFFVPGASLSVGVAIGHFMAPLEDLLTYAREAERRAKQPDRNGLAIHLHPHSGAPIKMRRSWNDAPDKRLAEWSRLLREEMISSKAAYALRELARDYMHWPKGQEPGQTIVDDAVCLLSRKELTEESKVTLRNELNDVRTYEGLNALAEELLVARQMSVAEAQAKGPKA